MSKPSIGIALGGGGVRGAAHIGVIQELEDAKVGIDIIAGVSAGAVVGAMYAYSKDGRWIEEQFRKVMSSTKFDKVTSKKILEYARPKSLFGKCAVGYLPSYAGSCGVGAAIKIISAKVTACSTVFTMLKLRGFLGATSYPTTGYDSAITSAHD